MRVVAITGMLLVTLGLSSGTTLQQLSMDDMIRKSTEIVRGKVHCTGAGLRGSVLFTNYRVQVTERWKGLPAAQLDFVVPGGASNGIRQTYAGAPTLVDGQEFVLFLWTSRSGLRQVIGLSQGLFNLTQMSNGQLFVTRDATTDSMLGPTGQPVQDANFSMPLADMRTLVANTLTGRVQ